MRHSLKLGADRMRSRMAWRCLMSFLWLLAPLPDCFSESLRIEGEIQYWRCSSPTSSNLTSARQFVAILDTNRNWSLSTKPIVAPSNSTSIQTLPQTVVGDNQTICLLEQFSVEMLGLRAQVERQEKEARDAALDLASRRFWLAAKSGATVITNRITVLPKTIPSMDYGSFSAGIWLPYFSAARLDWKTVQELPRMFSMRSMSEDHGKCRVIIDMAKATDGFPRSVSFLRNQDVNGPKPKTELKASELSSLFIGSTVEAQFRVIEVTNYMGRLYPKLSQMDYFKSTRDASASDSGAYVWVRVEAHSFAKTDDLVLLPTVALPGKTHVLDDRLTVNGGKRIDYVVDKKVPDLNAKEEMAKLKWQQDTRKALMDKLKEKNPKAP